MSVKKQIARPTLVLLLGLAPLNAAALDKDLSNAVQTVGGIYGSILIHEVGHALVAKGFGATNIRIKIPREESILSGMTTVDFPPGGFERWQLRAFATSGLIAENFGAELVIQNKGMHDNPFAQSILGTGLFSNAIHVYTYYTKWVGVDGYRGNDIDSYARHGGNPHVMSAALVAYTAFSLHRMRKKQIPLFYVNLKF